MKKFLISFLCFVLFFTLSGGSVLLVGCQAQQSLSVLTETGESDDSNLDDISDDENSDDENSEEYSSTDSSDEESSDEESGDSVEDATDDENSDEEDAEIEPNRVTVSPDFSLKDDGSVGGGAGSGTTSSYWTDYMDSSGFSASASTIYISSAEQLAYLAFVSNDPSLYSIYNSKYYLLTADIDLSGHYWIPIGLKYEFTGSFNGNGHVISGMTCYLDDSLGRDDLDNYYLSSYRVQGIQDVFQYQTHYYYVYYMGFFGRVLGGAVSNLIFRNASIETASTAEDKDQSSSSFLESIFYHSQYYFGILAGSFSGSVSKVGVVSGSIDINFTTVGVYNTIYIGGLVGSFGGTMTESFCSINLTNSSSIQNTGNYENGSVGGLVGNLGTYNGFSGVSDSYFFGHIDIYGYGYVGGIVGRAWNDAQISTCYFYDTGTAYLGCQYGGGIVGKIYYGSVLSCFTDATISLRVNSSVSSSKRYNVAIVAYLDYSTAKACSWNSTKTSDGRGKRWLATWSDNTSFTSSNATSLLVTGNASNFYKSSSYLAGGNVGVSWNIYNTSGLSSNTNSLNYTVYTWSKYVGGNTYLNNGLPVLNWSVKYVEVRYQAGSSYGQSTSYAYVRVSTSDNSPSVTGASTLSTTAYVLTGTDVTFTALDVAGYTFSNWRITSSDGPSDNPYSTYIDDIIGINSATANYSYIIIAYFVENSYTVRFIRNYDSSDDTVVATITAEYGTTYTFPTASSLGLSRSGYTLSYWAVNRTATTGYQPGASFSNLSSTNGATVTLYAVWEMIGTGITSVQIDSDSYYSTCNGSPGTVTLTTSSDSASFTQTQSTNFQISAVSDFSITVTPNVGYALTSIVGKDSSGQTSYLILDNTASSSVTKNYTNTCYGTVSRTSGTVSSTNKSSKVYLGGVTVSYNSSNLFNENITTLIFNFEILYYDIDFTFIDENGSNISNSSSFMFGPTVSGSTLESLNLYEDSCTISGTNYSLSYDHSYGFKYDVYINSVSSSNLIKSFEDVITTFYTSYLSNLSDYATIYFCPDVRGYLTLTDESFTLIFVKSAVSYTISTSDYYNTAVGSYVAGSVGGTTYGYSSSVSGSDLSKILVSANSGEALFTAVSNGGYYYDYWGDEESENNTVEDLLNSFYTSYYSTFLNNNYSLAGQRISVNVYYSLAQFTFNGTIYVNDEVVTEPAGLTVTVNTSGFSTQPSFASNQKIYCATQVKLTVEIENNIYLFLGWYDENGELISDELEYSFEYSPTGLKSDDAGSYSISAKFIFLGEGEQPTRTNGVYYVTSADNLIWIMSSVASGNSFEGSLFIQMNDIDMSDISDESWVFSPIGTQTSAFKGIYDGNYYLITNLNISYSTLGYVGLFGYTDGATIRNLTIYNGTLTGGQYIGAVAGYASNTTFTNVNNYLCSVSGTNYVGGVVGYADNCTFLGCSNQATVSGSSMVAGLVGYTNGGTIDQCYANSTVLTYGSATLTNYYVLNSSGNKVFYGESGESSTTSPRSFKNYSTYWTYLNGEYILTIFYWYAI